LEKINGTVRSVINGTQQPEPLLDVDVASPGEMGMLGIAVAKNQTNNSKATHVFLYYTEYTKDGDDPCQKPSYCMAWEHPKSNNLYRYDLVDNKLVNPKLLLKLPALQKSYQHNGGSIVIGPDNNIYIPVGELNYPNTWASNVKDGLPPKGTGGILRLSLDGQPLLNDTVIGNTDPLALYYAYGVRNSFGLDFDPVSKKLWDTENGPSFGDEVNIVEKGFNSGWKSAQGIWKADGYLDGVRGGENLTKYVMFDGADGLVGFTGKGKYSSPEFTWNKTVGVTALKFLGSDNLGKQYENDLFVASYMKGIIYHFDLKIDRSGLLLSSPLDDTVADSNDDIQSVVFGKGFVGTTDLEVGPDGYLYVLDYSYGKIYRIVPNDVMPEH
jgi:glucose/arabinose dehydrogenase